VYACVQAGDNGRSQGGFTLILIGSFEFERAMTTRPSTGGKCTSGTLDSRQNVHFPPVESRVVSARSNLNGPIRVEGETTLRAAVVAGLNTSV